MFNIDNIDDAIKELQHLKDMGHKTVCMEVITYETMQEFIDEDKELTGHAAFDEDYARLIWNESIAENFASEYAHYQREDVGNAMHSGLGDAERARLHLIKDTPIRKAWLQQEACKLQIENPDLDDEAALNMAALKQLSV